MSENGIITGADRRNRCFWAGDKEDYVLYHDQEWGYPVDNDFQLFEKICLEGFQSGLSWLTILRKRVHFREAFEGFDYQKVSQFGPGHVEKLVQNEGIIRHRGKIESVINNAKQACELANEFGSLGAYFWRFEPDITNRPKSITKDIIATELSKTPESTRLSKDLKKRGWSFVGPTTAYAFMQAMGMVNDHLDGCDFREKVERKRKAFVRP